MLDVKEKGDPRRTLSLFLILVGVASVGVDVASLLTKRELCPFTGCRLAASSHYAKVLGLPLPLLGLAFFAVALLLVAYRRGLRLWLSVGVGFSIYLVMVQLLVLHKVCPLCMVVEAVTLLLLIVNWSWESTRGCLLLVVLSFFASHMLYFPPFPLPGLTPPPAGTTAKTSREKKTAAQKRLLERFFTWRNDNGTYCGRWELFFDLDCPGCASVIETMAKDVAARKVEIVFRNVLVHKEAFAKSCELLRQLESGGDIWALLRRLHDAPDNSVPNPGPRLKREVKRLLDYNLDELLALRGQLVPTLVVTNGDKTCIYSGPKAIRDYMEESRPKGAEEPLWNLGKPGICTPHKECR